MRSDGSLSARLRLVSAILVAGTVAGCGKTTNEPVAATSENVNNAEQDAPGNAPDPQAAAKVVHDFLQAIKTGDEDTSNALLTPLSRQKTAEYNMAVAPTGSETATFTVGEVELPEEGGGELAHVQSTWTDIDDDGQSHTDEILWVLRHESEGWRIGGMATKVFEDQPALLLDFEDPADMRRKQELAEAEMERRARAAADESEETPDSQEMADTTDEPVREKLQAARPPKNRSSQ